MARKTIIDMSAWPSLSLEGNLIAPAMIAKIDQRNASEQSPEDYAIRKGLTIREEIATTFRVGQSHFDAFSKLQDSSQETTKSFVAGLLKEAFGFDDLENSDGFVSLIDSSRVPFVVVPPAETLDRRSPTLSVDRSRSPAFALQDYLNDKDEALWGIVTNGTHLRLMRNNASLTRPAYIEADLAQIFSNEDIASFAILWLLVHRSRFGNEGAPATDCSLERWRDTGSKEGEVARDRLAAQVQIALKVLGSGFLEANPDLATKLKSGEVNLTEWFNELLRLVYRLIFLMVAEDRNLLHPTSAKTDARTLYAQGYSLAMLRKQCYRAATWDKHHDRYEGVKIVFKALANGQQALALPALGGLFADDRLPHLETARLRNKAFMEALYRLSWLSDKTGMVPVNWRAMETEELGSVYESLLELQPQLGDDGKTLVFASEAAEQKGNQRKTTGSYYTPDSLVQALLDTALDPVLDKTEPDKLLKLTVIDPACGSGHFLLAAARRIATRLARHRAEGTPALSDFRHALRDVARSCLHGVDRNPMAVELTKVALWIETVDPGLPLGFFDAQIRCGDALLGVFDLKVLEDGIPDAAYKPLTGDDKDTAKYYLKVNRDETAGQGSLDLFGGKSRLPAVRPIATEYTGFRALSEDTIADIATKDRRFRNLRESSEFRKSEIACDLYVAAFLAPKTGPAPTSRGSRTIPTTSDVWQALDDGEVWGPLIGQNGLARRARAFHWPLEFPDVMQRGGFDVVLGNPPWERIKLQEQEFFASSSAEIASAPNKAARDALIKALAAAPEGSSDNTLFKAFTAAKRRSEANSEFARTPGSDGGRFPLTGRGDVNTYALFSELAAKLVSKNGRSGIIVPTGISTDSNNQWFFRWLLSGKRLISLYSFYEIRLIFTATDDRNSFCLLTLGQSENDPEFAFSILDVAMIADDNRKFSLSADDIHAINPTTGTAAIFRSKADAELTATLYRSAPPLSVDGANGNPWGAFYLRLVDFGDHSDELWTKERAMSEGFVFDLNIAKRDGAKLLPVYESKYVNSLNHRFASSDDEGETIDFTDYADLSKEIQPRYWVNVSFFAELMSKYDYRREWLLGYRDITNSSAERTTISVAIPLMPASRNLPVLGFDGTKPGHALLANLSSIVLDYASRQKVGGTHLTFTIMKQLPILPPDYYTEPRLAFITPRILELTYTSHSLAPFARELGHDGPPFAWDEKRRAELRAELDAFYARAYDLTRDALRYILDPVEVKGLDYPSETFRVLKNNETRKHGEYRTRRLVLAAWDRMEADGTFAELGLSNVIKAADATPRIVLPVFAGLRDGAWAWSTQIQPQDRLRYAAQYALWLIDPVQDAQRVRFLIASLAEPALLTPLLSDENRGLWIRLAGEEARPIQGVTRLRPQINAAWRTAFNTLISSGQLEERDSGDWIRGRHFINTGLNADSADAQRAMFALQAIRQVEQDQIAAAISEEDNIVWARFGHGTG